jgi:TRAP-type C4-dicarboxylate transport system permease small subunit
LRQKTQGGTPRCSLTVRGRFRNAILDPGEKNMDNGNDKNQPDEDRGYKEYTLEDWLLIVLMLGLFVVVSIQVWGRLIFQAGGLAWTDELSRILLVGLVYMSMGVVSKYDLHFKIDRIPHLPQIVYKILDIISILVTLAIMVILVVYGAKLMKITANTITPALGWTKAVFYAPLTIGSIFVIYHTVRKIVKAIRR